MRKRLLAVLTGVVMVGSTLFAGALPAVAQAEGGATGGEVPATPNIVDPAGDANMHSAVTGVGGGLNQTGADILAVWFTNDATNLYTHIQTATGARAESLTFVTYVGPAPDTDCIQLRMTTEGEGVESFSSMQLSGDCGTGTTPYTALLEEEGPDGTSILTGAFPLAEVEKVATAKLLTGPDTLVGYNLRQVTPRGGIIDDTPVGTDYTMSSGSAEEPAGEPKEEPPGKSDPPGKGKKKGCSKGKGEKKGSCPGKKPKKPAKPEAPAADACPAYVPGEQGAEAETTVVGADATAEKPIEVLIDSPGGTPNAYGHNFHNIQVDAAAAEAGLYVAYEFPIYEDHDIYLNYASGTEAAHTGGFNPAPVPGATLPVLGYVGLDGKGSGGHSEQGGEYLDGIKTADCAGYTLDMTAYLSEGGEMSLKLWLGEPQYDPAPDGEGAAAARSVYDFFMSF